MRHEIYRWLEGHRWAGDALLATALEIATTVFWFSALPHRQLVFSCALLLPLYLRRTWPELVLVLTTVGALVQLAAYPGPLPGDLAVLLVVHAAARYAGHRRWGTVALITGLVGAVLAGLSWIGPTWLDSVRYSPRPLAILVLAGMAAVLVSYLIGLRQRDASELNATELANLRERNKLLATDQDQRAELATAAERTRIARELHDIVAHSLAVIVVQADGAAAASAARPELARPALATIAETSREALAEMRQLVAVLRSGPADPAGTDYLPTPGPDDLHELVEQVRRAGVPVDLRVNGDADDLPAGIGLTLYRLIQESLTNVIRHAGPAATAVVTVQYEPDVVTVAVSDDGRGLAYVALDPRPDGHGLPGMRERVGLLAGNLRAGPRPGGGFLVEATLPVLRQSPGTDRQGSR